MIGLIRLAVIGMIALTVVYVLLSLYSASVRRERLEKQWEASGAQGDREAFIAEGMAIYRQSLRRKLILLVYVVPVIVVSALVYLVNFS